MFRTGWIQSVRMRAFLMILMFYGMTCPGWAGIPPHERAVTIVPAVLAEVQVAEDPRDTILAILHAWVSTLVGESMASSMDDEDHIMILHTLEYGRADVPSRWINPSSRNIYTMTLIAAYRVPEGLCHEYALEAVVGGKLSKIHNTACLLSDGNWRVAAHD